MAASLFSARWYRVADLKPRLRPQVRVQRRCWRDQLWYQLVDDASGRHHRLNDTAYQFVGRCDGQRNVQQVWDALIDAGGDAAPTQDEVVDLLIGLHDGELIQFDRVLDIDVLFQRRTDAVRRRRRSLVNPFAFRMPLGDPNALLARLDPLARWLFRAPVFWLWLLAVTLAALAAASNWSELSAYASLHLRSPGFLALLWGVFPVLKLVHEVGHGMAVRRWGGEVHEAGVSLLVLVPAPYVDASSASSFLGRRQRALVGGAGIMVELAVASLGLLLWLQVADGSVREVAFALAMIGSLSTLLFNGNPLLRFDGYYVLCDVLDLPNLATRSGTWWNHLLRRGLLRLPSTTPQLGAGERKWLLLYAPLSLAYRVLISLTIVLWLAGVWTFLALAAAAYFVVSVLIRPLARWASQSQASAAPGGEIVRTRLRIALLVVLPALLLFAVPLPYNTVVPAIVWLPEKAQLRPEVDGFIAALPVADAAEVAAGDLIVRLNNPELLAERENLVSRLLGLEAERYRLLLHDPVGAQQQAEFIARSEAELANAERRLGLLEVRAQAGGRLVMPRQVDLPGSFATHGSTLGYVFAPGDVMVRAAVPEKDIHLVQTRTVATYVKLVEAADRSLPAQVRIDTPAATRKLPSAALSEVNGGPFVTNPNDSDAVELLEPVFLVDLQVDGVLPQHVGERAWVRFDHGYASLAAQLYRRLSQLFLKQARVAG
ncbi:MAG: hypothetical protein ABI478_07055 [Propionivibrio sp.]